MHKYDCDLAFNTRSLPIYEITRDILSAAAYIHSRGFIHGDIKPTNILLDLSDRPRAVLCDFGISIPVDEKYHITMIQTITYRAPEVNAAKRLGQFSEKIDIWSIGCVMFELAAGEPFANHSDCADDDSTITACKFFQINLFNSRKERLKVLRDLFPRYVTQCIKDAFADKMQLEAHINSGFISLMAMCLMPNHTKRISATTAIKTLDGIIGKPGQTIEAEPVKLGAASVDWVVTVSAHVLAKCSRGCVRLAYSIYCRAEPTQINTYASLYIASCIYSGSLGARKAIKQVVKKEVLRPAVIELLTVLDGAVF